MTKLTAKIQRGITRLLKGEALFLLPNGQWKFGGNKFVSDSVAQRLPIDEVYTNNKGMTVYRVDPDFAARAALVPPADREG